MDIFSSVFCEPPQKPIRLACAGLGFIFRHAHAAALGLLQSQGWPVEVAMVCDREQAALDSARQFFPSAKPARRLEEILDSAGELDALLISLWPPLECEFLRQAIARGFKNILVEKPVSHNAADIRLAVGEARRAGVLVEIAYNRRHQPALPSFAQAVHALDPLESVSATLLRVNRHEPLFYEDVMPHPLSVLYGLLGKLTVLDVRFGERKNGIPEFLEATLQNASGVRAALNVRPSSGRELELYEARSGDRHLELPFLPANSAHGAGWRDSRAGVTTFHGIPDPDGLDDAQVAIWRTGFVAQMAGFLRGTGSTGCSLEQAAAILEISEAIFPEHAA